MTTRATSKDRANPIRQYGGLRNMERGWARPATTGDAPPHACCPNPSNWLLISRNCTATSCRRSLTIQDFGITWEEIEPYYTRAEEMMGTSGKAGNLNGVKIEGGNIFEGPRSKEFPNPPHAMPYIPLFVRQAAKEWVSPVSDAVVDLEPELQRPRMGPRIACQYCGHCSGFGCMVEPRPVPTQAIADPDRKKNFKVETHANVRRVVHKVAKAVGVSYVMLRAMSSCNRPKRWCWRRWFSTMHGC